jgi:hypothetical protein
MFIPQKIAGFQSLVHPNNSLLNRPPDGQMGWCEDFAAKNTAEKVVFTILGIEQRKIQQKRSFSRSWGLNSEKYSRKGRFHDPGD